jgi:transcriptional regulator with XRE-family HTH domain
MQLLGIIVLGGRSSLNYGERLRNIRKEKGLSARQIADALGIKPPYISDLERGKKGMTISTLEKICKVLNISLADFFQANIQPVDMAVLDAVANLSEDKKRQLAAFLNDLSDSTK